MIIKLYVMKFNLREQIFDKIYLRTPLKSPSSFFYFLEDLPETPLLFISFVKHVFKFFFCGVGYAWKECVKLPSFNEVYIFAYYDNYARMHIFVTCINKSVKFALFFFNKMDFMSNVYTNPYK